MIQQAGVIPFRRVERDVEICLITSFKAGRWTIPKGIIDPPEDSRQTALKEAQEEAGLEGRLIGDPIGSFRYEKWDTTLEVLVYLLEVTHAAETWPEAGARERRWVKPHEAETLIKRPQIRKLLRKALARIDETPE